MNLQYSVMKLFTFYFLVFSFTGCGYKSSSYYAKDQISGKVYVDLHVDIENKKAIKLYEKMGLKKAYFRMIAQK